MGVNAPKELKDEHWPWDDPPEAKVRLVYSRTHRKHFQGPFQRPVMVRDEDGKKRPVIRILYRLMFGVDFPYPLRRTHGCNYTCVNPYHVKLPDDFIEVIPDDDKFDDIEGLVEEIQDFVAINGYDRDAVFERFLLDYSEEEIGEALQRINS